MVVSGKIGAKSPELKAQVDSIISCLEEIDVRTPKEYKTIQLAKFKALHQEIYELTQAAKDVFRYDLEYAWDVGNKTVENHEKART